MIKQRMVLSKVWTFRSGCHGLLVFRHLWVYWQLENAVLCIKIVATKCQELLCLDVTLKYLSFTIFWSSTFMATCKGCSMYIHYHEAGTDDKWKQFVFECKPFCVGILWMNGMVQITGEVNWSIQVPTYHIQFCLSFLFLIQFPLMLHRHAV